jgi:hypothetical protein
MLRNPVSRLAGDGSSADNRSQRDSVEITTSIISSFPNSTLPTLPNLAQPKSLSSSLNPLPSTRLHQSPLRRQHLLLSQHPSTPMHTQRFPTLRIHKDIHRILRTRMHVTEHPPRFIRTNRYQAQVKGTAVMPDLCEGGADGEVRVFF